MDEFTKADLPKVWDFSGPCGKNTHYQLRIFGRPSARAIRHLIKQLELTAEFVDEPAADAARADVQGAKHLCKDCGELAAHQTADGVWLCEGDYDLLCEMAVREDAA